MDNYVFTHNKTKFILNEVNYRIEILAKTTNIILLRYSRCSSSICCLASAIIDLICSEVKSCVEIRVAEKSILIRLTCKK